MLFPLILARRGCCCLCHSNVCGRHTFSHTHVRQLRAHYLQFSVLIWMQPALNMHTTFSLGQLPMSTRKAVRSAEDRYHCRTSTDAAAAGSKRTHSRLFLLMKCQVRSQLFVASAGVSHNMPGVSHNMPGSSLQWPNQAAECWRPVQINTSQLCKRQGRRAVLRNAAATAIASHSLSRELDMGNGHANQTEPISKSSELREAAASGRRPHLTAMQLLESLGVSQASHTYLKEVLQLSDNEHRITSSMEDDNKHAMPLLKLLHSTLHAVGPNNLHSSGTSTSTSGVTGSSSSSSSSGMPLPAAVSRPAVVVLRAPAGSSRSLAYLVPAMEQARAAAQWVTGGARRVSVVVVAPTTELASRVHEQAFAMAEEIGDLRVQLIHGGVNIRQDLSGLRARCPDILVATPGRLLELLTQHGPLLQHMLLPPWGAARQLPAQGASHLTLMVFEGADLGLGWPVMRSNVASILRLLAPKQLVLTCQEFSRDVEIEGRALALKALQQQQHRSAQHGAQWEHQQQQQQQHSSTQHGTQLAHQHEGQDREAQHGEAEQALSEQGGPQQLLPMLLLQAPTGFQAALPQAHEQAAAPAAAPAAASLAGRQAISHSHARPQGPWQQQQQQQERRQAWLPPQQQQQQRFQAAVPGELRCLVVPADEVVGQLYRLLLQGRQHQSRGFFKAIVLCPTAAIATLYCQAYRTAGVPAVELTSRKSREYRIQALELLRQTAEPEPGAREQSTAVPGVVLFATDTLLQGMELPGIDLIVQVGCARDAVSHARRMQLTGAIQTGSTSSSHAHMPPVVALLMDKEAAYFQHLCTAASQQGTSQQGPMLRVLQPPPASSILELSERVQRAASRAGSKRLSAAYLSMLSYYLRHPAMDNALLKGLGIVGDFVPVSSCASAHQNAADMVNLWARSLTEGPLPQVPYDIAQRMGLGHIPGVVVAERVRWSPSAASGRLRSTVGTKSDTVGAGGSTGRGTAAGCSTGRGAAAGGSTGRGPAAGGSTDRGAAAGGSTGRGAATGGITGRAAGNRNTAAVRVASNSNRAAARNASKARGGTWATANIQVVAGNGTWVAGWRNTTVATQ